MFTSAALVVLAAVSTTPAAADSEPLLPIPPPPPRPLVTVTSINTPEGGTVVRAVDSKRTSQEIRDSPQSSSAEVTPATVLKNIESFGMDLLRKTREIEEAENPDANVFISPHSVYTALSMLAVGAGGRTREQLMQSLLPEVSGSDLDDPDVVASFHEAVGQVLTYTEGAGFNAANSVWGDEITNYYETRMNSLYDAEVGRIDLSQSEEAARTINTWIEDNTNGLIKDVISPRMLRSVVAVLVNAIYFKQEWKTAFKASPNELQFTTAGNSVVSVESMSTVQELEYCRYMNKYDVVFVPYENGKSAAVVAVPLDADGADDVALETDLPSDLIAYAYARKKRTLVNLTMPTLDLSEKYNVKELLEQMGVPMVGDFSRIAPRFREISDIVHATALKVDKKGTEAAAATVITGMFRSLNAPRNTPIEIVADRPFVFGIVRLADDEMSSEPSTVFVGSINKPEGGTVVQAGDSKRTNQRADEPSKLIQGSEAGNAANALSKKRRMKFKNLRRLCLRYPQRRQCRRLSKSSRKKFTSYGFRSRSLRVSGTASSVSAAEQTPCKVGSLSCTWFYVLIVGMIGLIVSVGIGAVIFARRGAAASASSSVPSTVAIDSVKVIDVDSL